MASASTHDAEFLQKIRLAVARGNGFIPLIGSGMSAMSGIMMGQDFSNYLANAVRRAIDPESPWDIRRFGWPPDPATDESATTQRWLRELYRGVCARHGYKVMYASTGYVAAVSPADSGCPPIPLILRDNSSPQFDAPTISEGNDPYTFLTDPHASATSRAAIDEAAVRALEDWRYTLKFLSQIAHINVQSGMSPRLVLDSPQPPTVDAFNLHITRGRKPNLGHAMLAHLSRPLRIRTVLTTNFDTLIEEAFSRVAHPLQCLPVSTQGALPVADTVLAQHSIVKLHGEVIETRADRTLDDEPSLDDKRRFANYFGGIANGSRLWPAKHLLVLGYSGSDKRCVKLIKYLLDTQLESSVYWVCYSNSDVHKVTKVLFKEPDYEGRLHVQKSVRPDLLLYELYQELSRSLPAGGLRFEFQHSVPPQRDAEKSGIRAGGSVSGSLYASKTASRIAIAQQMGQAIATQLPGVERRGSPAATCIECPDNLAIQRLPTFDPQLVRKGESRKRGEVLSCDVRTAGLSSLRVAFDRAQEAGHTCVWVELQDHARPTEAIHDALRAVAAQRGRFQLDHLTLVPRYAYDEILCSEDGGENAAILVERTADHFATLVRELGMVAATVTVFFYGRNGAGACSGWSNKLWDAPALLHFRRLIDALGIAGINVVYSPLTELRVQREAEKHALLQGQLRDRCERTLYLDTEADTPPHIASALRQGFNETEYADDWQAAKALHKAAHDPNCKEVDPTKADAAWPAPLVYDTWSAPSDVKFSKRSALSSYTDILHLTLDAWLQPPGQGCSLDEYKHFTRRIHFLYALTLFRQARTPASFFSHGILECPRRFNAVGIDNDELRAREVLQWVEELELYGVLYEKPGGYLWMYRDVRLGLQSLLQDIPLFAYRYELPGCNWLGELRSRMHYTIALWYNAAYASTGHSSAAIEALYHGAKAVEYAPSAKPRRIPYELQWMDGVPKVGDRLAVYRLTVARAGCSLLLRTLSRCQDGLRYWLPASHGLFTRAEGESWEAVGIVDKSVTAIFEGASLDPETLARQQKLIASYKDRLRYRLGETSNMLRTDSGWERKSRTFLISDCDPVGADQRGASVLLPDASTAELSAERHKSDRDWYGELERVFVDPGTDVDTHVAEALRSIVNNVEPNLSEYRNAYLTTVTATDFLDKNAPCMITSSSLLESLAKLRSASDRLDASFKSQKHNILGLDYAGLPLRTYVVAIGRLAYLYVRRAKLEYHAGENEPSPSIWVQASALCAHALEMWGYVPDFDNADDVDQECRLNGLYALCLGHLGRFKESHRHLNGASAAITRSSSAAKDVELASLRLRRAEVHLAEAVNCALWAQVLQECVERPTGKPDVHKMLAEVVERSSESGSSVHLGGELFLKVGSQVKQRLCSLHPDLRSVIEDTKGARDWARSVTFAASRLHASYVDDAVVAMDSAERLLSGQSHSSLWWGRLCTLRLRCIREAALAGGVGEHSNPRLRTLVERQNIDHAVATQSYFSRGLIYAAGDAYKRLRVFDYSTQAINLCKAAGVPGVWEKVSSVVSHTWQDELRLLSGGDLSKCRSSTEMPGLTGDLVKRYYDCLVRRQPLEGDLLNLRDVMRTVSPTASDEPRPA